MTTQTYIVLNDGKMSVKKNNRDPINEDFCFGLPKVQFFLNEKAIAPRKTRHSRWNSYDIFIPQTITINAFQRSKIRTGIYLDICEGYRIRVLGKTRAKKMGIDCATKLIYEGRIKELKIWLQNTTKHGVTIGAGLTMAKIILEKSRPFQMIQTKKNKI